MQQPEAMPPAADSSTRVMRRVIVGDTNADSPHSLVTNTAALFSISSMLDFTLLGVLSWHHPEWINVSAVDPGLTAAHPILAGSRLEVLYASY